MDQADPQHPGPPVPSLQRLEMMAPPVGRDASVLGAAIVPGLSMARRHPVLGPIVFGVGVVLPLALLVLMLQRRHDLLRLALERDALRFLLTVAAVAVLARLVAVLEARRAYRRQLRRRVLTPAAALVVVAAMAVGVLGGAIHLERFGNALDDVFLGGSGSPLYVAPGTEDAGEFATVLLLGGDEGVGRWGLRTDTMILVMVHRSSGRAALVSIPRNLARVQFPPGSEMHRRFPAGFEDLANAIFPYVSTRPDLERESAVPGLPSGAIVLSKALGYSLGVSVDDVALVNMLGFAELVDAVGGVSLELERAVALPPSPPGARSEVPPSIGPGTVRLDGTTALAYVRTRYADSDYQRMGRQRELLVALFTQVGLRRALASLEQVSEALRGALRTSLTPGELSSLVDVLGDAAAITESLGLIPPLVQPGRPDYGALRLIMEGLRQALRTGEPFPFPTS